MPTATNKMGSSDNDPFKHDPLPQALTHIRVLEIIPFADDNDSTIRCRLKVVRLLDFSQCYTALSHMYGNAKPTKTIMINGAPFEVRQNLYDFLCTYRKRLIQRSLPTVFLWVDALCIDMQNVRERNDQMSIIGSIFQRAKVIFAWLHDSSDNKHSSSSLSPPVSFFTEAEKDLRMSRNTHNDRFLSSKYLSTKSNSNGQTFASCWKIMMRLCCHGFWSRLFIIAEIYHAQELVFMTPELTLSFSEFRAPFVLLWAMSRLNIYESSGNYGDGLSFEPISILTTAAASVIMSRLILEDEPSRATDGGPNETYGAFATERWHWTNEREPLPILIHRYENWQCTERLDKIYALLSLSDSDLTIDYDRSNIELFCAVILNSRTKTDSAFVHLLGRVLDIPAFKFLSPPNDNKFNSLPQPMDIPSIKGSSIQRVYSLRQLQYRTELSDVINARLGITKTMFYRFVAQANLAHVQDWMDLSGSGSTSATASRPGSRPGTGMGLSHTRSTSRSSNQQSNYGHSHSNSNSYTSPTQNYPPSAFPQLPRQGTPMRIVDGLDLHHATEHTNDFSPSNQTNSDLDTSTSSTDNFRTPIILLNNRKPLLGLPSSNVSDFIQDGDILCVESSINVGIVLRISGLSKTWLTIVGVILLARNVTVTGTSNNRVRFGPGVDATSLDSRESSPGPGSTSLTDFVERSLPTPFRMLSEWNRDHMAIRPTTEVRLRNPLNSLNSRKNTAVKNRDVKSPTNSLMRRFGNRSDRIERWLDVVNPHRRAASG